MSADLSVEELVTFSLVMPSHNRREQLTRAIEHLRAQTYPAHLLELVVVLDGCSDGSAERLEQLRPSLPFALQVISQGQRGPSGARNTGIQAAKNEYILMLDDDVMATPDLVMEHWRTHQRHPNTVVIGTMSQPADYVGPVWSCWEQYILERQYQDILQGKYALTPRQFYTGNCSLKRSWILEAGLFDEDFKRYEDVELAFRLFYLGLHFKFNEAAIGYHYAYRSYPSWAKTHYLYGRYAVKIERDKHVQEIIQASQNEFAMRNWITRWLATKLLNRKLLQQIVNFLLLQAARLAWWLKQAKLSFKLLSCIANILYWQGFNEELNQPVQPNPKSNPVESLA